MMKRILGKGSKRLLSGLLCLILVLTSLSLPAAAAGETETGSTYTELTFADFGLADGKYTSPTGVTFTGITSLDKVAISGKLAIGAQNCAFRIGGTDNAYVAIVSFRSNGAGTKLLAENLKNGGGAEVCDMTLGQKVDLRITFDYVGEDVLVKFYVNGAYATEYTAAGTASVVKPTIQIADANETKWIEVESAKQEQGGGTGETTYTELTFADFGLADGKYTTPTGVTSKKITSLDKVAVSGKLAIGALNCGFRIGGTDSAFVGIASFRAGGGGTNLQVADMKTNVGGKVCDMTLGEKLDLRITFDYVNSGADVLVNVYVGGVFAIQYTSVGTASAVKPTIQISDATAEKWIEVESVFNGYKELTFTDFGLADGEYTTAKSGSANLASWDKVAISGKVTLQNAGATNMLCIGSRNANDQAIARVRYNGGGTQLIFADMSGGGESGVTPNSTVNTPQDIRVAFDLNEDGITYNVTCYLGGVYAGEYKTKDITQYNTLKTPPTIDIRPNAGKVTIESVKREYTNLTVSDWDLNNGLVTANKIYSLKDTSITSFDGYAFECVADFHGALGAADSIRIGSNTDNGNLGVLLWAQSDTKMSMINWVTGNTDKDTNGNDVTTTFTLSNWSSTGEYAIRMTFDEIETDRWVLTLWVNGTYVGARWLTGTALGTKLLLQGSSLTVRDLERGDVYATQELGYTIQNTNTKIDETSYEAGGVFNTVGDHTLSYTAFGQDFVRDLIVYMEGDANVSGDIDVCDLVRMKRYVANDATVTLTKAAKKSADLNSDDSLTDADAGMLRTLLVKKN